MKKIIFFSYLLLFVPVAIYAQVKYFPKLAGLYLGQKPPGMEPEVFAPGIVNTVLYTRDIAISKDGNEIYFCVADADFAAIFMTKCIDNHWTEPVIAPFSGMGFLDMEPCISSDGNKIFFLSNRPPDGKKPQNGWAYQKIWVTERTETGWTEPQALDEPVNSHENEFFPSVTNANVLYFTRMTEAGKAGIYKSKYINNSYHKPELLTFDVPDTAILFNAFISPNEDFIITCALNIDSSNIDQDYYISFKNVSGTWSKLIKFGPKINTPKDNANSAFVSPDGKYMFFSSSRRDLASLQIKSGTSLREIVNAKSMPGNGASAIYWIDAKIIEELRPKD